ncbi:MAG: hypothetical protein LBI79_08440 [Nitrososphaerota archaeon]|jgi:hypothetical protein|nr:hypothetical protein [Nitrososphaerota archaeon]
MSIIQKYNTKLAALVISAVIIAALLPLTALAETDTSVTIGKGVRFTPKQDVGDIPWTYIEAHTIGDDGAFTPPRRHFPNDDSHIQLDGNEAYFYGYYTGRHSDYLYYKESDSTEKTFKFSMFFSIYPVGSDTPAPQRWHSLRSVGFLVNCVENDDETISGYYFSLEPKNGYNSNHESQIVVRMLDHMDFNILYEHSNLISATPILDTMDLENSTQIYLYEIKSSQQAFSVMRDDEEIFSFNVTTADASKKPAGYTGGNDFGFYAGYMGSEDGHTCSELSFAEFKNIEIWTKSVIPTITEVNWNNGNGNGNGGGINQLTVNGITLKNNKNYLEPEIFNVTIAKTTLTKNDPTAIYTVIGKTVNEDGGQYEKIYNIKIAFFEDGAWRIYAGKLAVDNPGGNVKANI